MELARGDFYFLRVINFGRIHGKAGDIAMKEFNTTGGCNPVDHYMVDISERLKEIKRMVDAGKYFCINRARQYGKTTTMQALADYLKEDYTVIALDFQNMDSAVYENSGTFTQGLARLFMDAHEFAEADIPESILNDFHAMNQKSADIIFMDDIFRVFLRWCKASEKKIVLMIDEVDTASNNQVFLDFLAQLRSGYLKRRTISTFWSVILAGVTDVKHLKAKIRPEEAHKENSPWNIAADFDIDMSLSEDGIRGMLEEYEDDHHTGMDIGKIAEELRAYTGGYPYLVSRICQHMDGPLTEKMGCSDAWTIQGIDEAVKLILADGNDTLFGSIMGKLVNIPQLKKQLRDILMKGDVVAWRPDDEEQKMLFMYGFIVNEHNTVKIANRLFEMRLYQYFLSDSQRNEAFRSDALLNKSIFINDDHTLNMPLILEHFVETQKRVHGDADDAFLEEEGRERFLTYIAPIINGTGTYSVEEQTRDKLRTDVVIHYLGQRYVVELKIWRGPRYNAAGEKQIREYLDYFGLNTGYMVSFNFNKKKERGVKRVNIGDKVLFEATV